MPEAMSMLTALHQARPIFLDRLGFGLKHKLLIYRQSSFHTILRKADSKVDVNRRILLEVKMCLKTFVKQVVHGLVVQ
jgi:hypothetical protein